MLEVRDLAVELGGSRVLDGVSLDVPAGEVVAVLGPSGCGKTTLLRAVAGLAAPAAGHVRLDGADLAGVPTHRRGLGLMFQDHALFPHLDVAGNVAFGLRMQGVAAATRRRRVAEVLELVRLGGFGDRAVSTLSGGERQRVALARALAPGPRLLMLDEPLASLDRGLRESLVLELGALFAELELAVLYVTHDQGEALALADQLVVLRAGRVAQAGRPDAVWEAPADGWVARFLGQRNVLTVTPAGAPGSIDVLVRPGALAVDAAGPLAVEVVGRAFAGDRTDLRVQVAASDGGTAGPPVAGFPAGTGPSPGAELDLAVAGPPPALGARLGLRVDPAGVVVLGPAGQRAQ